MRRRTSVLLAVVLAAVAAVTIGWTGSDYQLDIVMPAADGIHQGTIVTIHGRPVGEITSVGLRESKALVSVEVDEEHAPLHAGTTARISWESVVGSRRLELLPGPAKNPELPSGKLIESKFERVELDDVLAALDKPTRDRLQGLARELQRTLDGQERELNAAVRSSGPALQALGEVLRAVGEDGPAIRALVGRMRGVTSQLVARQDELGGAVGDLSDLTAAVALEQRSLGPGLHDLPPTIRQANKTLGKVPDAVDATVPLLSDLQPATRRLPAVSRNLSPVLRQLRPAVAELRPTLAAARSLLGEMPEFLDSAHQVLPATKTAMSRLQPAAAFLRPYTPELVGWLSNWTSLWSNQSSGNYGRALLASSATSFNDNPGVLPPGFEQDPRPAPGSIAGQPWMDANGDGMR